MSWKRSFFDLFPFDQRWNHRSLSTSLTQNKRAAYVTQIEFYQAQMFAENLSEKLNLASIILLWTNVSDVATFRKAKNEDIFLRMIKALEIIREKRISRCYEASK